MTPRHLAGARIRAQGLAGPVGATPVEVARSFVAHQGQDAPGVMASLALRSAGGLEEVLAAVDRGEVVRGYPMRGTVFAVAADTVAWLTDLCAAGPLRAAIARRGALGIEERDVDRAAEVLAELAAPHSERGRGRGVLRRDLLAAWEEAGIATGQGRGYHLLVELIMLGHAVYGPWREQETAVVLADAWLPPGTDLEGAFGGDRTAAAAELALRYLTSHGPASVQDLAWWSKLPLRTLRPAIEQVRGRLESGYAGRDGRLHATADRARGGDGEQLWWRPGLLEEYAAAEKESMRELLLPGFDELVLGYRDRLYLMDPERHRALVPGNNGVFQRAALRRGEVVGTWTRTGRPGRRSVALTPLRPISERQHARFEALFAAFPYTAP
ncbi:winged helix DNA-binding domain-containing protein [Brachybacterium sp. YJGR34]|uniref:winged helix DNA-binding domain-containing protein n=1 Tax=Brachybacterium sp. YJGR34 TaxID=2059911 RepID=UPI000E0BF96D|nr:winged helix DNA-binding domain-containing protein [Brachybacterium sp. YJGR34]